MGYVVGGLLVILFFLWRAVFRGVAKATDREEKEKLGAALWTAAHRK